MPTMRVVGIFLNPEVRTGGHRRYLELLAGLASRGTAVVLLKNRNLDGIAPGVQTIDIAGFEAKPAVGYSVAITAAVLHNASRLAQTVKGPRSGRADGTDNDPVVLIFGETHFLAGAVAASRLGAGVVFAFRSNLFRELCSSRSVARGARLLRLCLLRFREAIIAAVARMVVFQSKFDREDFLARHPWAASKCRVVPNNSAPGWFDERYRAANRSNRLRKLLFVGALNERKGVLILLEAFRRLIQDGLEVELHVAGYGPFDERLRLAVAEPEYRGRLVYHGRVADPFELLSTSDLAVIPSLFDSYPNVIFEAAHVGTPVVATRVGGVPEIMERYEDLLVQPGDPAALASTLATLINSDEAYRRARESCNVIRGKSDFDWVDAFLRLLGGETDGAVKRPASE